MIFGLNGVIHVLRSRLHSKLRQKKNPDIVFGMVNTETDPEIGEYFEVTQIPGILVIREQAGIHAQVGEIGAPAFDEIIKWARDFDMTPVREYYKEQAKAAN